MPLLTDPPSAAVDGDQTSRVLEEILELTRNNHKILRSPEAILPEKYLEHVLRRIGAPGGGRALGEFGAGDVFVDLLSGYSELTSFLTSAEVAKALRSAEVEAGPLVVSLRQRLRAIDAPIRHMGRRLGLSVPTLRFMMDLEDKSGS